MILYRALNNEDRNNIYNHGTINCSLNASYQHLDTFPIETQSKIITSYNGCCKNIDNKFILSYIYGHINGNLIKAKRSPWISTTSDFFTAYSYARLYKCKETNYERRSILCFEVDDELIINNMTELREKNIVPGTVLDLSGNKLTYYQMNKFLLPFEKNNDNFVTMKSGFMSGIYSKADNEYLIANYIKPTKYLLLTPLMQDKLFHKYGENITDYFEKRFNSMDSCEVGTNANSLQLFKKMV